jgi:hypothetical protein
MHTHTHGIFRGGTVASPGGGETLVPREQDPRTRGRVGALARAAFVPERLGSEPWTGVWRGHGPGEVSRRKGNWGDGK